MAKSPFSLSSVFQQAIATFWVQGDDAVINEIGIKESTPTEVKVGFALDVNQGDASDNRDGTTATSASGLGYVVSVNDDLEVKRLPRSIQPGDVGTVTFLDANGNPTGEVYSLSIRGSVRGMVDPIVTGILGEEIPVEILFKTMKGGTKQ